MEKQTITKMKNVIQENYTKNFESLCKSLKLNKIQQKILDDFIHKGRIRDQYVGRVAGTKKEKRIYAAKKKFTGSIDNRTEALMKALKVNAKQRSILDAYLKTGNVIGKYTGSIAGSTKTTKSYSGFRGFKEHFETSPGTWQLDEGFVALLDLRASDYKKFEKEMKKLKDGQRVKGGGPKVKAYKDPDYGGMEWDGVSNSKQFKAEIDKILKKLRIGYEAARVLESRIVKEEKEIARKDGSKSKPGIWDAIRKRRAEGKPKLKPGDKGYPKSLKGHEKKEEVEEGTFKSKFSDELIFQAIQIALSMGGNMTGAYKKIEKLKRGLGDQPHVAKALRVANESVVNELSKAKRLELIKKAAEKIKARNDARAKKDAMKMMKQLGIFDEEVNERSKYGKSMNRKDLMRKHGRELKQAIRKGSLDLSQKAEEDLLQHILDNYPEELRTDDDDDWVEWLDNNLEDFVKGKGYK